MAENYSRERDLARRAVVEAARLCRAVQREIAPGVLSKNDKSPVTVADFGSQAIVGRALRDAFPSDPLIAEEDSTALRDGASRALLDAVVRHLRANAEGFDEESALGAIDHGAATEGGGRFWTLDPIDGTKGFLRREQYAIALALMVEGRPVVAALACPNLPVDGVEPGGNTGSLFLAVRGNGVTIEPLDERGDAGERPIRVSRETDPARWRCCESVESSHSAHDVTARLAERLGLAAQPVRMDSQAKYGVVARGDAELYFRFPTRADYREKIWDHAAGVLVIEEAGGRVTDIHGESLDFRHGRELIRNQGILASNGVAHDEIVSELRALGL